MRPTAAPVAGRWPSAASPVGLRTVGENAGTRWSGAFSVAIAYGGLAVPLVTALVAWRGISYWEYSEGAYALTARMLLDGASLYGDVVAAQPPLLFYAAAAILSVHDSLEALRAALTLPLLATGLLVSLAVWRLTRVRPAAVTGGLATLVTPWTLHEGTLLMPETFAAPLLMGAALVAAAPGRSRWAGALAAVAASVKLAFVLPLLAVGAAARRPRGYLVGAAAALALLWAIVLAVHGPALVDNVLTAQLQSGRQPPRLVLGLWLQAAWNLAPLVLLAGLAWPLRTRAHDSRLLLSLATLALGSAAVLLTLVKHGSYLNVVAAAEPPLVALATCAVCWLFAPALGRAPAEERPAALEAAGATPFARLAAVFAIGLVIAQSASLLASPAKPAAFVRPLSHATHGRVLSSDGVRTSAQRLGACPPRPWAQVNPFLAFVAGEPILGGQPDRFIVRNAAVHAGVRRRALLEAGGAAACARRAQGSGDRPDS